MQAPKAGHDWRGKATYQAKVAQLSQRVSSSDLSLTAPSDDSGQPEALSYESWRDRVKLWARPRAVGLFIALAIELLLLWALISLGASGGSPSTGEALVSFDARNIAAPEAPEPEAPPEKAEQAADPVPVVTPPQETPVVEPVVPAAIPVLRPPVLIELPRETRVQIDIAPPAPPTPAPPAPAAAPAAPAQAQGPMGPPNTGGSGGGGGVGPDTARVGTMPNGEPLYAAAWYREPLASELAGYLSTATGPGWGLIACRTAAEWRVEQCVMLDESPKGSNIGRSALAAAWQFKVRPPRVGGKVMIGEWVRIRIDYGVRRG